MRRISSDAQPRFLANLIKLGLVIGAGGALFFGGLTVRSDDASANQKRTRAHKVESVVKRRKRPLVVVVALAKQRVSVFDGDQLVRSAPISSGAKGRRTPKGIFTIIQKRRTHFSNLYDSAPMPFMQRITWSGIALHEGRLPGYPASHGCIRLPGNFARGLFRMTSMGTRVIVVRDMLRPKLYAHPALFRPLPFDDRPVESVLGESVRKKAEATKLLRTAVVLQTSAELSKLTKSVNGGFAHKSLIDVLPANAAEATAQGSGLAKVAALHGAAKPRLTRAQLAVARKAKMTALKEAVALTRQELKAARAAIAEKRLALRAAGKTVAKAKRLAASLQRKAKKAKARAQRAARALIAFERRYRDKAFDPVADAGALAKAAAREDVLEAQYFSASEDAELAALDAQDMRRRLPEANELMQTARLELMQTRKDAKQKLSAYNAAKVELRKLVRAEKNRHKPISIFISRRTGKLYVRQGYRPIYETAVTITDPGLPVGTHVFTALQYNKDKSNLIWSVVTTRDVGRKHRKKSRKSRRGRQIETAVSYPRPRADSALDRIQVPVEARYEIAKLIKPGSSLIISDRRASPETGEYTDFIVSLN